MIIEKIKKQSQEYGVPWWKLPDMMMIYLAVLNIFTMIGTYWWFSSHWYDPRAAVLVVAGEAILITVFGNVIVETTKKVVSINRLRREFIDIMSHQMRTPTSITRWYIELLLGSKESQLSEKQRNYISSIADANSKMISLINDLLNLINVEDNKTQFNIEKTDLKKIVEQTIKSQALFATSRNITVDFKSGRLRQALAKADPIKFKMALENILNNAIKYSPSGGKVEVKVTLTVDGWLCEVKDSGLGIKQDEKAFIFEKFYRTKDKRKLDIQGTGLGLFICKALISGMDGDIWFTSKEGKGTSFFLRLPKQ